MEFSQNMEQNNEIREAAIEVVKLLDGFSIKDATSVLIEAREQMQQLFKVDFAALAEDVNTPLPIGEDR